VGTEFPVPFPNGYGQQIWNRKRPSDTADDWVIVDRINVPTDAGEYVLRWRWDTEQNPQVSSACVFILCGGHFEGGSVSHMWLRCQVRPLLCTCA
jgi:hypothetical protein